MTEPQFTNLILQSFVAGAVGALIGLYIGIITHKKNRNNENN